MLLQIRWYDLRYTITASGTAMSCADKYFCPLPVRGKIRAARIPLGTPGVVECASWPATSSHDLAECTGCFSQDRRGSLAASCQAHVAIPECSVKQHSSTCSSHCIMFLCRETLQPAYLQ